AEESQLDYAALAHVLDGELLQGFIQFDNIEILSIRQIDGFIERKSVTSAAALRSIMSVGVIDHYSTHHPGDYSEEVRAVLQLQVLIDHPQICFMNQRRGLKSVIIPLFAQIARGHPAQFVVDQIHQVVERFLVSVVPSSQ